ncbi:hypothetical protein [Balneatrix alpica]|uniref:Uncharacterized protein n=1 Tax=Balneatrix alpica TaxID=75684 RepID=A0ABV5Z9C4_9GAMM|nr:hypothetical protein [Balneatrix alpica]
MKPRTVLAMQQLIAQVRQAVPFATPVSVLCTGVCHGCSKKLLDFLDLELLEWEQRLAQGETPTLGDLQKLAKTSQKVYRVLAKNGLVPALTSL